MIYFDDFLIELLFFFGIANLFFYSLSVYNEFYKKKQNDYEKNQGDDEDENESNKKQPPIQIPYEQKYLQEYKKRLENINTTDILEKRNLKNSFIIEKTPLGNVAMYYNEERECFEYYSDNTIPYRYLETIGRKYVLTFDCLSIYIDMEEELKKQKEMMEKNKEFEKIKKEQEQKQNTKEYQNTNQTKNEEETQSTKKNIFAKLKNYNKSSNPIQPTNQATRANQDQEIKNPIKKNQTNPSNLKKPNTIQYNSSNLSSSSNSTVLLKEKSNSYLSKGRFSNFNILQIVKKEIVDKNYKMSFKDFKNLNI